MREWSIPRFDLLFAERVAIVLRKVRERTDPALVLGSIGWTALVYIIVHFGGTMT